MVSVGLGSRSSLTTTPAVVERRGRQAGRVRTALAASLSEILNPAGGDVLGWVGIEAQVAVVGVAEAAFELGPVVPGFLREPVAEGVS